MVGQHISLSSLHVWHASLRGFACLALCCFTFPMQSQHPVLHPQSGYMNEAKRTCWTREAGPPTRFTQRLNLLYIYLCLSTGYRHSQHISLIHWRCYGNDTDSFWQTIVKYIISLLWYTHIDPRQLSYVQPMVSNELYISVVGFYGVFSGSWRSGFCWQFQVLCRFY